MCRCKEHGTKSTEISSINSRLFRFFWFFKFTFCCTANSFGNWRYSQNPCDTSQLFKGKKRSEIPLGYSKPMWTCGEYIQLFGSPPEFTLKRLATASLSKVLVEQKLGATEKNDRSSHTERAQSEATSQIPFSMTTMICGCGGSGTSLIAFSGLPFFLL